MKTDILILGGGLSALVAADTILRQSDCCVTLLQEGAGASPYIHGFCMPVGQGDSVALFEEDTLRSGYWQNDPLLVRRLCEGALPLLDYFRELGLDLDRKGEAYSLVQSLGSSVPRIACIQNSTGPAMLRSVRERLKRSGRFRELTQHRAMELVKQDGRVVGVRCCDAMRREWYTISAGAIILASGGFGRLFPESTNSPDMGGDGCAMALLAGAELVDMEFIQFEPSVAVWPPQVAGKGIVTTMFYDGAVLRGTDGRRFMLEHGNTGEQVGKDVQARCIYRESREHGATPHGGVWFDATRVPEEKWQGIYRPYLERYLSCGIDLRKEPVEVAPAAHTTCGGVRIDENCRTGLPGLIACGEVTGGVHGANRLGGNAGLETMVFGRIAGLAAIADCTEPAVLPENRVADSGTDANVSALRQRMGRALRNGLNVVRNAQSLEQGSRELEALLEEASAHRDCARMHRLYNDLLTAYAAFRSATLRRESVGCHCRSDSRPEGETYRVAVRYQEREIQACKQVM